MYVVFSTQSTSVALYSWATFQIAELKIDKEETEQH